MQKEKIQILGPVMTLHHSREKDLEISWNFTGLMGNQNFETYHVFVFFETNIAQVVNFIEMYYAKMRFGELIGIYEENENKNENSKIKWNEKTAFGFNYQMMKKKSLVQSIDFSFTSNLYRTVSKLNGLVLINVVFGNFNSPLNQEPNHIRDQMKAELSQNRKTSEKMDKVVLTFIAEGSQTNEINCLEGVNLLYYQNHQEKNTSNELESVTESELSETYDEAETLRSESGEEIVCNLLSKIKRLLVVKKIIARIYVKGNKNILSHSNEDWTYIDNEECLEKVYYSVPACNFKENFIFFTKMLLKNETVNLDVTLDCTFYDGNEIQAKGSLCFEIDEMYLIGKTFVHEKKQKKIFKIPGCSETITNLSHAMNYIWILSPS